MGNFLAWHEEIYSRLLQSHTQGRMPHALLLAGAPGVGKMVFARRLAHRLLCEQPSSTGEACRQCRQCLLLKAGSHPDFRLVLPEEGKKQINIDIIRELVAGNTLSVGTDAYRIFVIHPADAMGRGAANALLKTLEEPIEGTLIILISSRIDLLPITIRSRCQLLKFAQPGTPQAIDWLKNNSSAAPAELDQALLLAQGAPLRAAELVTDGELEHHNQLLNDFVAIGQGKSAAVATAETWLKGSELAQLFAYLSSWLSALIRQKMTSSTEAVFPLLQSLSEQVDLASVYKLLDKLHELQRMSMNNLNPQLALESILLEWGRLANGER
jgi:DNA polymerase-3 subunit delta'